MHNPESTPGPLGPRPLGPKDPNNPRTQNQRPTHACEAIIKTYVKLALHIHAASDS